MAGQPYNYILQDSDALGQYQKGVAEKQKAEQEAFKLAQQQQFEQARSKAFDNVLRDPSPQNVFLASQYIDKPEQLKALNQFVSTLDNQSKQKVYSQLAPIGHALLAGAHDSAIKIAERRANAFAGADDEAAQEARDLAQMIKDNPAQALITVSSTLNELNPDGMNRLYAVTGELRKQAEERRNVSKEAREQSKDLRDAEMQGWNIKKIQNDIGISRLNAQIAAANAASSREGNTLKQQELLLKVQELTDRRDQAVKTRIAEGESVVSSLQNTKALLSDILSKENRGALQTAVGRSAFLAMTPGTEARTMAGKIEQLQNAVAAVNLDKLKGAMSDKDILFLKNIESNLDRYQDESAFIKELSRISNSLDQGISRAATKYGMPEPQPQPSARTPAQFTPRQPAAQQQPSPSANRINALLDKYGTK